MITLYRDAYGKNGPKWPKTSLISQQKLHSNFYAVSDYRAHLQVWSKFAATHEIFIEKH